MVNKFEGEDIHSHVFLNTPLKFHKKRVENIEQNDEINRY